MSPSLRLETGQPFAFRGDSREKPLLDVAAGAGKEHVILSHIFQGLGRLGVMSTRPLRSQPGNSGYPLGVLRRISCSCPMSGDVWEQPFPLPGSSSPRPCPRLVTLLSVTGAGDVAGLPAAFLFLWCGSQMCLAGQDSSLRRVQA